MTAADSRTIRIASFARRARASMMSLLALAALCAAGPAYAAWQNWTQQDGLADNEVFSVAEAADGALLFGTLNGASRFDGLYWTTYGDSLPSPSVKGYIEDRLGRSWFATAGGLARWDGLRWTRWYASDGVLPNNQLECILEDHRGDLWIGTPTGLVRYEPASGAWTTYDDSTGPLGHLYAWNLFEDSQHRLWVGTPKGVSYVDSTRTSWASFLPDPAVSVRDSVFAVGEDAAGGIWLGTYDGAYRLASGTWSHFTYADGLPSQQVTAIARDGNGHLWFGGFSGVARWDGSTFRQEGQSGADSLGRVLALRVDHSGNVWAGTLQHGASRYDGVSWNYYYSNSARGCLPQTSPGMPAFATLPNNCVGAMLQDRRGDAWFATATGGTARLGRDGRTWSVVGRATGVPASDSVVALAEDRGGAVWIASEAVGVAVLDSTRSPVWTLHRRTDGLASDSIATIYVDGSGDVWAGTSNGASRWHAGAWTPFLWGGLQGVPVKVNQFLEDAGGRLWLRTSSGLWSLDPSRTNLTRWSTADGLADDDVMCMLLGRDGAVWFGTAAGVSRLSGGAWRSWATFGNFLVDSVRAVAEDPQGSVWVGTDAAAAKWDGSTWRRFSIFDLQSNVVSGFSFDASGTAWLATSEGMSRWNGSAWLRYTNGKGIPIQAVSGFLQDSQQQMWFGANFSGSVGGLVEFEPDRTAPQTVFVTRPLALWALRNVAFAFGAAYGEVANLEYSTAWDGGSWSPWTSDNTWSTSGVADGSHVFAVRSRDWARNVDTTAAVFRFEVDATVPPAAISSPAPGQPVRGRIAIQGSTADPRFASWTLQAGPAGVPSWTDPRVRTLATGSHAVSSDTLSAWDTAGLAEGGWDLRLSVADTLGLVGVAQVRAIVDNLPPYVDVTSPVKIVAHEGGELSTTQGEVHLYFPPDAFDADAVVSVDSLAAGVASDTLAGGGMRRSAAWAISWTGGRLQKPGVLELRPDVPASPAAVFRADSAGAWHAVGGTAQQGVFSLALGQGGSYAVFTGVVPSTGGARISPLRLTPRAFSPSGKFASRDVAIAFDLAASGSATVRIYNRAGRLVRTVAEHWAGGTGENLLRWDGRDADGRTVESGLYLVCVEALGDSRTQTLAVMP